MIRVRKLKANLKKPRPRLKMMVHLETRKLWTSSTRPQCKHHFIIPVPTNYKFTTVFWNFRENAYNICHNVQDLLYFRGFFWQGQGGKGEKEISFVLFCHEIKCSKFQEKRAKAKKGRRSNQTYKKHIWKNYNAMRKNCINAFFVTANYVWQ